MVHIGASHKSCFNLIVLAMRSDKPNIRNLPVVVHRHHQSVIIAFDVEDYPVTSNKAGQPSSFTISPLQLLFSQRRVVFDIQRTQLQAMFLCGGGNQGIV